MFYKRDYYNFLAKDYHLKRTKYWKALEIFLNSLEDKGFTFSGHSLDLGCANGRNFRLFVKFSTRLIGIDNSIEFLKFAKIRKKDLNKLSKNKGCSIQLILSDILYLPIRPSLFNNIFSIATIHHLKNKFKRKQALLQINNILKTNGYVLITLWRKFQRKYRKFFIYDWFMRKLSPAYIKRQKEKGLEAFGDKFVPWTISQENKKYYRFYHFFSFAETKRLLKGFAIKKFQKTGGPNKKDNFFVLAQKIE